MRSPLLVLDRVRKVYTQGRILRRPTFALEADLAIDQPAIIGVSDRTEPARPRCSR